jgi:hypothetical protein
MDIHISLFGVENKLVRNRCSLDLQALYKFAAYFSFGATENLVL